MVVVQYYYVLLNQIESYYLVLARLVPLTCCPNHIQRASQHNLTYHLTYLAIFTGCLQYTEEGDSLSGSSYHGSPSLPPAPAPHYEPQDPDAARTERLAQLLNRRLRGDTGYVEQNDPLIRAKHDRHLQDVRQYYENEITALKQAASNAANAAVSSVGDYEPAAHHSPPASHTSPLQSGVRLSPPLAPAPHPVASVSPLSQQLKDQQAQIQQAQDHAASQAAAFQTEAQRKEQQMSQMASELNEIRAKEHAATQSHEQALHRNNELEQLLEQQRSAERAEVEGLAQQLQEQTRLYEDVCKQLEEHRLQLSSAQGGQEVAERQASTVGSEKQQVERECNALKLKLDELHHQAKDQQLILKKREDEAVLLTSQIEQVQAELHREREQAKKMGLEQQQLNQKRLQAESELEESDHRFKGEQNNTRQLTMESEALKANLQQSEQQVQQHEHQTQQLQTMLQQAKADQHGLEKQLRHEQAEHENTRQQLNGVKQQVVQRDRQMEHAQMEIQQLKQQVYDLQCANKSQQQQHQQQQQQQQHQQQMQQMQQQQQQPPPVQQMGGASASMINGTVDAAMPESKMYGGRNRYQQSSIVFGQDNEKELTRNKTRENPNLNAARYL